MIDMHHTINPPTVLCGTARGKLICAIVDDDALGVPRIEYTPEKWRKLAEYGQYKIAPAQYALTLKGERLASIPAPWGADYLTIVASLVDAAFPELLEEVAS
jgi:hypothetical protein